MVAIRPGARSFTSDADAPIVLMVEDDEGVLRLNVAVLERSGYRVRGARSLAQARRLLDELEPDVAVLDIVLPDGDGLAFASEVKTRAACPVLMLTGKQTYEDIVAGLTGDADDYLTKPYRIEELVARIAALIAKRALASTAPAQGELPVTSMACGPLRLDVVAQRAYLHGDDLLLTPKDFSLLLLLAQREGDVLGAQEVYEAVWGRPLAHDTVALKSAVYRLRKKLAGSGYAITARRGEGYMFAPDRA